MSRPSLLVVFLLVIALVGSSGPISPAAADTARAPQGPFGTALAVGPGPSASPAVHLSVDPAATSGWNWSNITAWATSRGSSVNGSLQSAAWDPALGGLLALVENVTSAR